MKVLYKVIIEANMDASHEIELLIKASNERNAKKLAEIKVRKDPRIFFTQIQSIIKVE